jgi:membrane protein implicated in regulation of membrane protease activity
MFILLAVLLLILLPDPWNLVLGLASLGLGGVEIVYWERRMRRHRVRTGVESLVGATGVVTTRLAPTGQIRVHGELWEARAARELPAGERVRIIAVDGLTLDVEQDAPDTGHTAAGIGAAAVLVIVLALAACGGDDKSASEEYADDVCSSLSTWVADVQTTVESLTSAGLSIDAEAVRTAADDIADSTQTLGDDLQGLGTPDTEDGQAAQDELETLTTELNTQAEAVQGALDSGGGAAAISATVLTAVSTAAGGVSTAIQNLQGLDPAGELRDAFSSSEECESLDRQIDEIRS